MLNGESKRKKTLGTKIQSMIQGEPLDAQNSPSGKAEAERVREGAGKEEKQLCPYLVKGSAGVVRSPDAWVSR